MNRPRLFIKPLLLTALSVCLSAVAFGAGHQAGARQTNSQELYDTAKRDYEAGAYRKALDTLEELLKADSGYAPAFLLKARAFIGLSMKVPPLTPEEVKSPDSRRERKLRQAKLLKEAADSLERFLQLKPETERAAWLREQLEALRVYAEPVTKPEAEWSVFSSAEVTEKAHVIRRPQPLYPEEARASRLSGTVKLLLVLAADGTVKHILVLQPSHQPLTESAIEAARRISFEPAIKDGHPVSSSLVVEYGFNTY
jgi:TonB family protein